MNKLIIGLTSLLIASPVFAHPRNYNSSVYYHPEKDVMVRKDWRRCKKIKYVTKYDNWGWYTERKVLPLKSCFKHTDNSKTKIKVIIRD